VKISKILRFIVLTALIIFGFSLKAGYTAEDELNKDALEGLQYILNCSECHGFDGNSISHEWPNIAGLNVNYIQKQLMDFKEGRRSNKDMDEVVRSIPSDEILNQLAHYYSTQKIQPLRKKSKKNKLAKLDLGEEIYSGKRIDYGIPGCLFCHGKDGKGGEDGKYPRLVGQYREYIVKQMKLFRSRERKNDVPSMMQNIARVMDDEDIESVAAYIERLEH